MEMPNYSSFLFELDLFRDAKLQVIFLIPPRKKFKLFVSMMKIYNKMIRGTKVINGQKIRSHLWLVDWDGSECVAKIEVKGERLKKSQLINKSFSTLGNVISTQFSIDFRETLCSLNLFSRARGIESGHAYKLVDLTEFYRYKQMVEKSKHNDRETKKLLGQWYSVDLVVMTLSWNSGGNEMRIGARKGVMKCSNPLLMDLLLT
ncbi:hypothetical protein V6N11_034171 [Hibiscus sabdariffa]|uniref:Kinesin motor domain-containing protein n=1 Tax=Hibiscus sabdariffa TaxID=183260 RepID=A0ABR2S2J2_9ROSI